MNSAHMNETRKLIRWYRKNVYGQSMEYIADESDASLIRQLTGQKTINSRIRECFRDLSGCRIDFIEVIAP